MGSSRHRVGLAASVVALAMASGACGGGAPPSGSPIAAGSPWLGALTPVALPPPVNSLTGLDCADANSCWAVGSTVGGAGAPNGAAVIATLDGGARWRSQVIPPTVGYLAGISCSDQRHCTAVGQASQTSNGQGVIIATSNGGATWTTSPTPPGILDVTAVACRPDRRCVASGTVATGVVALVSASANSGWVQRASLPAGVSGASAISCPDDRHCWVTAHTPVDVDHIAGSVVVTTDGGSAWAALPIPRGTGYLNGVSCVDESGTSGAAPPSAPPTTTPTSTTTPGVAGSTTPTSPAGVAGVHCVVVGTTANTLSSSRTGHGLVFTTATGGAGWSSQPVPAVAAALTDVTCPSADACMAVGSSAASSPQAGVVVLTGSSDHPWRPALAVGSAQPLSAVRCTSTSRCVLVGESLSEHLVGG
ncbi:MAG TPA: hypothetical protein VIC86_07545 [Acidimicrobiales bacterium]